MKITSQRNETMQKLFQTEAQIFPCPEYRKMKKLMQIRDPEEKYRLRPNPPLTILKNKDISQKEY